MNKNLHDIDDLFRDSLEFQEIMPSSSVRDKLRASLDKADAESYKKRLLLWKRMAIVLVAILLAVALFESGILTSRSERSNRIYAVEKATQAATRNKKIERNETRAVDQQNVDPVALPGNNLLDLNSSKPGNNSSFQGPDEKKSNYEVESSNTYIPGDKPIKTEREYDAFSLIRKNSPSISVTRKSFYPQVGGYSFLQQQKILENQNKHRIGFRPHWLISGMFAYEAAGYKLDSDLPNEITNIKHREVHEPSFSGGVLITRQLTIDWGLQSGLLYSKTNIGIAAQKIYAFQDPAGDLAYKYITSSGYAFIKPQTGSPPSFGDSVIATEGKHTIHYVTVPLTIKYRAGKNKFSFVPGVGIEANFLTGTRVETEIQTPSGNEMVFFDNLHGAKSFYWSLAADAEVRYHLNNKTMLSFQPSFHHSISPITENNIVETFPYSFRWGVGLTIKP